MSDYGFDSVFGQNMEDDVEFETMFGGDGDLIDFVSGVNEAGESILDADTDELHLNDTDAEPSDFGDELGPDNDTKNAPDQAEGSEGADDNEFALGEAMGGSNPISDADRFYGKDITDDPLTGSKVDPMENDLEGESDDVISKAMGEACGTKEGCGSDDEECEDGECDDMDLEGEDDDDDDDSEGDDFDLEGEDPEMDEACKREGCKESFDLENDTEDTSDSPVSGYEPGDADLLDMVIDGTEAE